MSLTEKTLVEDHIIKGSQEKSWKYVSSDRLERNSFDEYLANLLLIGSVRIKVSWNVEGRDFGD